VNDSTGPGGEGEGRSVADSLPKARVEDAVAHLRKLRPDGPWTLTAIEPDGPGIDTKTFGPNTASDALAWLEARSGRMNLYYMVNPAMRPLSKKATKEDVLEAVAIWVDIDPKKGEDPAAARADAITRLMNYRVPPSIVIDSGGGVQAIWLLDEPFPIDGKVPIAEDFELYNLHLEIEFRGDSCHNVDRILRLPGTINLPNAKKRKAGRGPRLAAVIDECSSWERHPLGEFWAAQRKDAAPAAGQAEVQLDALPPRLRDLDELPAAVTPRTRMLIVQGDDPDDQQRYKSRSEVTFAVVCELVRAQCSDEQIAAVLLDPNFGISAHTLAQKSGPLLYAKRQIARARAEVEEPMLRELNERHAVIALYGGKTRVVSWEPSEVDPSRTEIVAQSFDDFRNRYMHVPVQTGTDKDGNPKYTPAGKWWLEHRMRRQYRAVVLRPNEDAGEDEYNIWQGLAVRPEPGEWPLLRRLIVEGLAGGDERLADYIIRWSAFGVQNPGLPAEVALTFIGGKGTGKSTFGRIMCRIFGQHGVAVAGEKSLTSNFNKHLHGCVMLLADEAVPPGNRNAAGLIKNFITDETIMVEPKGVDSFPAPNRMKVIIASNNTYVVDASDDERRYAVFNVSKRFAAPPGAGPDDVRVRFWRDLRAEVNGGGIEAFLHDLLEMDLGDWHPRYDVPQTTALNEQRAASLKGFDRIWFDALASGELPSLPGLRDIGGGRFVLPTSQLEEYCRKVSRSTDISKNRIDNLLGPGQPDKEGVIHTPGMGFEKWRGVGPKGRVIPALSEARAAWDRCRFSWQWDGSEGWGFESAVIDNPTSDDDREPPARGDEPY
jgi:hypothetical protein